VKTIYPSDWTEKTGTSSPSILARNRSGIIFSVARSTSRPSNSSSWNFSPKWVPRLLADDGWSVEIHDDHFEQTTSDTDLLAKLGERGWAEPVNPNETLGVRN